MTGPERRAGSAANAVAVLDHLARAGWPELAAYMALARECDPGAVVAAYWERGRPVWLPRLLPDRSLAWHPVTGPDLLAVGANRIREPRLGLVPAAALPAGCHVVVPGLGFTRHGHRLGRGGGCYDRVLVRADLVAIGYAFPEQVLPDLPALAHDRSVRLLVAGGRFLLGDEATADPASAP